jgi:hypothetical protein
VKIETILTGVDFGPATESIVGVYAPRNDTSFNALVLNWLFLLNEKRY